jgi:hypothetical protein
MKVKKSEAIAMFLAAGFNNAAAWKESKLQDFLERAPETLPSDAVKKIKDKGLKNLANAIIDYINDKEDEATITLVADAKPKSGPAKKGRGRDEDDDEVDDEDDDSSDDSEDDDEDDSEESDDDDDDSEDDEDSEEDSEDNDEDDEPVTKKGKGTKMAKPTKVAKKGKRRDDDEDETPKKKKKGGGSNKKVERDNFGNALTTRAHKINIIMGKVPMTIKEIEKKSKQNAVSAHVYSLVQKGFAVKKGDGYKLIKTP